MTSPVRQDDISLPGSHWSLFMGISTESPVDGMLSEPPSWNRTSPATGARGSYQSIV